MLTEKVGVIGAGKIGAAIARGALQAGLCSKENLIASDVSEPLRKALGDELKIQTTADNGKLCSFADIVILAVKPQVVDPVAREIARKIGTTKLLVSVAAGVPLTRIESSLEPGARVVRVMPNIACVVGAGAAGYAAGAHATAGDMEKVGVLLNSFGIGMAVEEKDLDAVTGLSGSGPAYVFLFLEALADGGVQTGLSREVALKLALQTVYGAAKMALQSGKHLGALKDEVTSPGGTTIAGLYAMERRAFHAAVMDGIVAATQRSRELGKRS